MVRLSRRYKTGKKIFYNKSEDENSCVYHKNNIVIHWQGNIIYAIYTKKKVVFIIYWGIFIIKLNVQRYKNGDFIVLCYKLFIT